MHMSWSQLENCLSSKINNKLREAEPPQAKRIVTDSRNLSSGDWYLPLKGENFDGHNFINDAMEKGAKGFFYSNPEAFQNKHLSAGIFVEDTLLAYQQLASKHRSLTDLPVIAITGSNGKTTVKEMAGLILSQMGPCLLTQENFNNDIGVPKTLLGLEPHHKTVLLEFGARHLGDLTKLNSIANPTTRCLLNVGSAHLGEFGSEENLLKAKLEIFQSNQFDPTLVTFQDDPRLIEAAQSTGFKTITFGYSDTSNVRVKDVNSSDGLHHVDLMVFEEPIRISINHFHDCYPINMAAAAAISCTAGCELQHIKSGLESFKGVKGRFQINHHNGLTTIDDSYNANPQSMKAGIDTLKSHYNSHKIILVLGDMLELGEKELEEHASLGMLAANLDPEYLLTVGKLSERTYNAAISAGFPKSHATHCTNVEEAIVKFKFIQNEVKPGGRHLDILYVKGSNSIGLDKLVSYATNN